MTTFTMRWRALVAALGLALGAGIGPVVAGEAPPSAAWLQWNDPALDRLLEIAAENSTLLHQSSARLEEARALAAGARADRLPALDANASRQRSRLRTSDPAVAGLASRYATQTDLGMAMRWDIDLFGRRRAAIRGASARQEADRLALAQTRVTLTAEIARQYALLRIGDAQQAAERELADRLDDLRRIDAALAGAGLQSPAEQQPVEAELAARETSLQDGARARTLALARLRVLTGASDTDLDGALGRGGGLPVCSLPGGLTVPVSVVADRPDVLAAEALWRASREDRTAIERSRWPSLTLSGQGGWTDAGVGVLTSGGNFGGQLLAALGVRLLDFGRTRAERDAASARVDGAEAAYAEAILLATEAVDGSIAELDHAAFALQHAVRAEEAAQAAARIAAARLAAGLNDRRETLEVRRAALDRELERLSALQQKCEADVRLSLAVTPASQANALPVSETRR